MKRGLTLACAALLLAAGAKAEDVTLADLQGWLSIWQKREGLTQWKITLRVVGQGELPSGDDGYADWRDDGTAVIRVLRVADLERVFGDTPGSARRESELVIVHELMHLLLAPLSPDRDWSAGEAARAEDVTEAFSKMLLERRVPGGLSQAQFIDRQLSRWPFKTAPEAKRKVMLKLVRAMEAVAEDDVTALMRQEF